MANVDPYLDAGMRGFIHKTALKNHWRVQEWYELDDLVQDGFLCYAKCKQAYPELSGKTAPTQDERRHFMALVRTAFIHHITNLSNKRTQLPELSVSRAVDKGWLPRSEDGEEPLHDVWDMVAGTQTMEQGSLAALLRSAPAEVRETLRLLTEDAKGLLHRPMRKRVDNRVTLFRGGPHGTCEYLPRETTNEMCCRLLGYDAKKVNVVSQLKEYFAAAT